MRIYVCAQVHEQMCACVPGRCDDVEGQDTEWMRGQKSGLCRVTGAQSIRKHHKKIGGYPRPIWSWAEWREATGAQMGQQKSQGQSWLPWEDIDGIGCGGQR